METQSIDLWPDPIAHFLNSGIIPYGRRFFQNVIAPQCARGHVANVKSEDTAWILGSMVPRDINARYEKAVKGRCRGYIYHIMDNWFAIPELRQGAIERCRLADCLVVPTPQLEDAIREMGIFSPVIRLEEPIDVCRLEPPREEEEKDSPLIVWCGNPMNVPNLEKMLRLLNCLYEATPFRLRVISSGRRPNSFTFKGALEWLPYDYQKEGSQLAGARAGLAPLEDSPYNRCKGAYKIKTYFAAGVPVVASRVGYQETLLHDGTSGILVANDEEWLNAIELLLKDDTIYRRMANCAREAAITKYSHQAIIPNWMKLLNPFL
jgi:glycosyltransferase involved in cell wall biosynthesis